MLPASSVGSRRKPVRTSRDLLFTLLLLPPLLSLFACASMKEHLGMRVALDKLQVSSIQVSLPSGPGIAPGEKSPLVVSLTEANGSVLQTEGKGHGKVMWQDLSVTSTVVTVNQKGVVSLPSDPRDTEGKLPHVVITVPSHPGVTTELDIPIRYNYKFTCNFSGTSGSDGMNGTDGINGTSGTMGSIDPNNPSPGGNGGNGTDGSNGYDGSSGGNAPAVEIRMTIKLLPRELLQVSVTAAGKDRYFLIDPQGGSLAVTADGGSGGSGGRGGRGGRGGSGGVGTPNGSSGRDGSDGRNGFDGSQGRGGPIYVTYDPQAKQYLNLLHLSSKNGPTPAYREAVISPLW